MLTPASPVTEIMQTDLVTIGPSDSLKEAMEFLMDSHVSGLPVVESGGRCLGVLSVTDILGLEFEQAESATDIEQVGAYFNPNDQRWESMRFVGSTDELPDVAVREVMSSDLVSVSPNATLQEAAALMVQRRNPSRSGPGRGPTTGGARRGARPRPGRGGVLRDHQTKLAALKAGTEHGLGPARICLAGPPWSCSAWRFDIGGRGVHPTRTGVSHNIRERDQN